MRISDWSSDVCSSDLLDLLAVPCAGLLQPFVKDFGIDFDAGEELPAVEFHRADQGVLVAGRLQAGEVDNVDLHRAVVEHDLAAGELDEGQPVRREIAGQGEAGLAQENGKATD